MDLLEGLRMVDNSTALTVLQGALCETEQAPRSTTELLGKLKKDSASSSMYYIYIYIY